MQVCVSAESSLCSYGCWGCTILCNTVGSHLSELAGVQITEMFGTNLFVYKAECIAKCLWISLSWGSDKWKLR